MENEVQNAAIAALAAAVGRLERIAAAHDATLEALQQDVRKLATLQHNQNALLYSRSTATREQLEHLEQKVANLRSQRETARS